MMAPFRREELDGSLAAKQTVRVDISLEITNFDTIAADPFTYQANIRARTARLTGPVPRTVGGRPDLSGMWNGNDDLYPEDPELLPWAAAKLKTSACQPVSYQRDRSSGSSCRHRHCW